jgi:hypothetical protein
MNMARLVQIGATLAALAAVSLGLGTYSNADLTPLHIGFGVVVTLALLVLSLMAVLTGELRRLGIVGVVYALILPLFGATQAMIWPGDWHWLVQAAHLMVSFGAIPFIDNLRRRYMDLKRTATTMRGQPQPVS